MSILYIGNATPQSWSFFYRGQDAPASIYAGPNTGGPARIDVPANSVAQTGNLSIGQIDAILAQNAPYGLAAWSGSGVGYAIDSPITL